MDEYYDVHFQEKKTICLKKSPNERTVHTRKDVHSSMPITYLPEIGGTIWTKAARSVNQNPKSDQKKTRQRNSTSAIFQKIDSKEAEQ